MIIRSLSTLQSPPPWFWWAEGRLWQRLGPARPGRWPVEVLQQLHWWLIRPCLTPCRFQTLPPLPWSLTSRACWLNSYRPGEVACWWAVGVRSWRELAHHRPASLAWTVHAQRRLDWPGQCQDAQRLLQDKAALLALTPEHWRSPHAVLDPGSPEASRAPLAPPVWWQRALEGPGVVLKPLRGHGGRAVIRFRFTASGLEQQPLFSRLPTAMPCPRATTPPPPPQLLAHWQRLCRTRETALAAPYLTHSGTLPAADPSVVVRLITARAAPEAPIAVRLAWLEVPLGERAMAFLQIEGPGLTLPAGPLSRPQREALQRWQALLRAGVPQPVAACLKAALGLHALLPPIDQVAWDWIPADPQPLLLEGNGSFGLLVPQLLEQLSLDPLCNP